MKLIEGIRYQKTNPKKYAAMYYKTEPFVVGIGSYHHTNNWEIISAQEADHQALSKIRLFLSGKFKLIVFIYISLKDLNKSRNINIANVVDTIRP